MNLIQRIKEQSQTNLAERPYFLLLLPAFFVLHGMNENFGYVAAEDGFRLWVIYTIAVVACFGMFNLIYRNKVKAALLTTYLFCIFFFYGVFQDFLATHAIVLNRYSIWLPVLLVLFVFLLIYLKRTNAKFRRIVLYFNLLLFMLILFDMIGILSQSAFPPKNNPGVSPPPISALATFPSDSPKPDVYFLLFDEYASSAVLKKNMGFDNSGIDSFLVSKHFRLQTASSSNYNFTPFSMSSILNMSYISGINPAKISGNEYALCIKLLRKNAVTKSFISLGYDVRNYSIFDMEDFPAPIHQDMLPSKTELITGQTLLARLRAHLLWHFVTGRFSIPALKNRLMFQYHNNNNQMIDSVAAASRQKTSRPKFVYAHFMMPHPPYLFDSVGQLRDLNHFEEVGDINKGYLNNLRYTNRKLEEMVTTIQANTNGKAVIIVMGDHGYRDDTTMAKSDHFKNFNAVYLPPGYQAGYYDGITGVNQFRVLFNSLFKTNYRLLKDSTVFLTDQ